MQSSRTAPATVLSMAPSIGYGRRETGDGKAVPERRCSAAKEECSWLDLRPWTLDLGLLDPYQIDIKHLHPLRRPRLALVGQVLRDPEAGALAFDHQLHALFPAFDHIVEAGRERGAPHDRAV